MITVGDLHQLRRDGAIVEVIDAEHENGLAAEPFGDVAQPEVSVGQPQRRDGNRSRPPR
ncbi:hypothetical protein [Nocardia nova]|uniref:hypothetical protein n=1 Tax=Nocardia nova TaxID=37330 RepID=UPI002739AE73|nr:hypothetical protein [Nocardia nova]